MLEIQYLNPDFKSLISELIWSTTYILVGRRGFED